MSKPITFNYQDYVQLLDEYKKVCEENTVLKDKLRQIDELINRFLGTATNSTEDGVHE